ncbi:hypothetical protein [Sphingomonas qomolangmaensis]|uniref:Uncharacterized protein n=1 Tax=Sphingomonas qomolangmaensis TaxID=2918765 RepID=A0ABY5L877_9SPHN|nr:hypothetical protein [Sphingomonas qomolangmaensis]UUL83173.1 hypothetical protein NMP03_02755 [Sphingomonas qomolangmaensis]
MFLGFQVAFVKVACLAVCAAVSMPTFSVAAQTLVANGVAGTWAGSFAQTEWIFEFKREGDVWSGRYMSAKSNKWLPMQSLTVSSRTVRFTLDSRPPVTFSLEVDPTNQTLAGDVNVFGKDLPFSAARRS